VAQLATTVHAQLSPGLEVYVEYSNEIWNGIFSQGSYCEQQGLALASATTRSARLRFQSQRSVEIFAAFEQVYAADERDRLVRVMASQAANTWVSGVLLGQRRRPPDT